MSALERQFYSRSGVVTIWVAILGMVLVGFLAIAMDRSLIGYTAQQLQATADGSSLAGVMRLRTEPDTARQWAVDTAEANIAATDPVLLDPNAGNDADGDVVFGRYYRFADPPYFDPGVAVEGRNAIKVVARRTSTSLSGPLPLTFGPIFDVDYADVARSAISMFGGTTGAGIITLCPDCQCSLRITGTVDISVTRAEGYDGDASIQVDSNADNCPHSAMCGQGSSPDVTAPEVNIVAGGSEAYCWSGQPPPEPPYMNPGSPYIPDPLAWLPPPPYNTADDLGTITDTGTYDAGYYSDGIRVTKNTANVTLNPGIYIVDKQSNGPERGLVVTGGTFTANEVMFYVVGDANVHLSGNANVTITPEPDQSETYWGIAIFQARDNTNEAVIIGNNNTNLLGTYYFPFNDLEVGGTGFAFGNQIIAWNLWVHGTGTVDVVYDGRFPTEGYKYWLVE